MFTDPRLQYLLTAELAMQQLGVIGHMVRHCNHIVFERCVCTRYHYQETLPVLSSFILVWYNMVITTRVRDEDVTHTGRFRSIVACFFGESCLAGVFSLLSWKVLLQ